MALPGSPMGAPGADPADMAADPSAPQDTLQGDGSYTVCIKVGNDKTFTVYVEGKEGAEEGGEPGGEMGDDDAQDAAEGVPCKTVKESLTLALEIIRNDGVMPQSADDDFQQGFGASGAGA